MDSEDDAALLEQGLAVERRTPTQLAYRRFKKNRRAVISAILLVTIGLGTVVIPLLPGFDYKVRDKEASKKPPMGSHWMGTDGLGRDLMSRVFQGGRISFAVGILATGIAFALAHGVTLGFPIHLTIGVYLCWLRARCGSLLPGMCLHSCYNAAVVLLLA